MRKLKKTYLINSQTISKIMKNAGSSKTGYKKELILLFKLEREE